MTLLRLIIFLLAFAVSGSAATYYVDYDSGADTNAGTIADPFQRSPGMTGFAGVTTLSAGDVVMFNGGVVWPSNCFPLAPTSGTDGSPITYTSYGTGKPLFNGGTNWATSAIGLIYSGSGVSHVNIANIHFEHIGNTNAPGPGGAIKLLNPVGLTISNCLFAADCSHGIIIAHYAGVVPAGPLTIASNDFTRLANAIEIGGTGAPYTYGFTNITITGNHFHDFTLWNTDHGDGIHLFIHNSITNVLINLNRWDGSFAGDDPTNVTANTGFIYFEAAPTDATIINNVFAPEDTYATNNNTYIVSPGMIVGSATNWLIANNTFYGSTLTNALLRPKSAIALGLPRNLGVTNNIFYGLPYGILAIYAGSAPNVDWFSDYNVYYSVSVPLMWTASYGYTIAEAFIHWSLEGNSTTNQPSFIGSPTDLRLASNDTVAIGAGANLNAYFTTDITGYLRGGIWDIGAYQHTNVIQDVIISGSSTIGNLRIK